MEGIDGIDYSRKDKFNFISIIRLPDFVSKEDFNWAIKTATEKKKLDFSKVKFLEYDEGLCVQCMHLGSFDNETKTRLLEKVYDAMAPGGYLFVGTTETVDRTTCKFEYIQPSIYHKS